MSIEKALAELTAAVNANTAALQGIDSANAAEAQAPVQPVKAPAPAVPRTRPAPAALVAPVAPVVPAAPKGPDKAAVLAKGTELCKLVGRSAFTALCVKYGSATNNVSGLPVAAYAAVIAEAQELIDAAYLSS